MKSLELESICDKLPGIIDYSLFAQPFRVTQFYGDSRNGSSGKLEMVVPLLIPFKLFIHIFLQKGLFLYEFVNS